MIVPIVTLGGSDPESILDSYREARVALRIAMDSVRRCVPHPRDFREVDYLGAIIEHKDRLAAILTIIDQYEMLAADVICQQDQREKAVEP